MAAVVAPAPETPPRASFPLAHPWLTTWIVLSAIAGVVQIVQALTARHAPKVARLHAPPASTSTSA